MPRLISTKNLRNLRTSSTFTGSQNQTTFSFNYNVGSVDVYLNGVKLTSSEFTASNGTSVILSSGCNIGDLVELIGYVKL